MESNEGSFDYIKYGQVNQTTVSSNKFIDIKTDERSGNQIEIGAVYIANLGRTVRYTDQQEPAILVEMPNRKWLGGSDSSGNFLSQIIYRQHETGKSVKLNLQRP
ncbi:MAG: hypothetical protein Q7S22_05060 [Candidatus Micrarchaeota archaeon]|nr:hypothetical protein [Candidatus Micrarchaeota archaeon]